MRFFAVALFVMVSWLAPKIFAAESCSRYCNPERSKPCGNACIPLQNNCRKSWTTACVGERPASERGGKVYANPTKVDKAPEAVKR